MNKEKAILCCGKRIKENSSLVDLLKECEEDFEIKSNFKVMGGHYNKETEEEFDKDHVPSTIYEHTKVFI